MILYLFYIAIISSLLSGCDKIVLNAYVFFFYWLAENNTWRKWLSVMSNYQFISWTCWLDIVRNICGVLITSQVPMRSKETIAKSPNIFIIALFFLISLVSIGYLLIPGQYFWFSKTLLWVSRHYFLRELVLVWAQNIFFLLVLPCLPENVVHLGRVGIPCSLNFVYVQCEILWYSLPTICTLLVGSNSGFVDYWDTKGLSFGTSSGSSLISSINHMSFRSVFSGELSWEFLCTNSAQSVGI